MPANRPAAAQKRLSAGFAAAFTLAHIGAFIACLPLLSILAPLKAAEIAPQTSAELLSWTVLGGAVVASVVNIAGGALSDKTTSKFGRRRPWMVGGAGLTIGAYAVIWSATSPPELIAGIILFQIGFNFFLPALVALLPDEVPDRSKGRMAALLALGPPIGLGAGSMIAGADSLPTGVRYAGLATLFVLFVLPLLIFWKEPPALSGKSAPTEPKAPDRNRLVHDFRLVWLSRLFTQIGIATSQGFLLLFVIDAMSRSQSFPPSSAAAIVGQLLLLSTTISVATALSVGAVSDRLARRRSFVAASGALICAGMAVVAASPDFGGLIAGQSLYGLGVGLYSSAEVALAAETLPSRRDAGRDLAVLNLGNTLPQALAPAMALVLIGGDFGGFPALFYAGAICAAAGGLIATRISRR